MNVFYIFGRGYKNHYGTRQIYVMLQIQKFDLNHLMIGEERWNIHKLNWRKLTKETDYETT